MMRDLREDSAHTGDSVRGFSYTLALIAPWLSLGILGAAPSLVVSTAAVGFWLWWLQPRVGLNRRPAVWLATLLLIFLCGAVALIALEQILVPGHRVYSP